MGISMMMMRWAEIIAWSAKSIPRTMGHLKVVSGLLSWTGGSTWVARAFPLLHCSCPSGGPCIECTYRPFPSCCCCLLSAGDRGNCCPCLTSHFHNFPAALAPTKLAQNPANFSVANLNFKPSNLTTTRANPNFPSQNVRLKFPHGSEYCKTF